MYMLPSQFVFVGVVTNNLQFTCAASSLSDNFFIENVLSVGIPILHGSSQEMDKLETISWIKRYAALDCPRDPQLLYSTSSCNLIKLYSHHFTI